MNALRSGIAAIILALAATASPAATMTMTLTSLTAGGTLSAGGLLFDSFLYTDVGASYTSPSFVTVSSDDILVTASSVGDVVTLSFEFSVLLTVDEAYEISGLFKATATGAVMISVDILLGGQSLSGDSVLGHSVSGGGSPLARTVLGSGTFAARTGSIGPGTLASLSSLLFGWGSSGEAENYDSPGTLSTDGFDIVITLERDAVAVIPLPATLPLLLVGLGGFGLARRRRRSA